MTLAGYDGDLTLVSRSTRKLHHTRRSLLQTCGSSVTLQSTPSVSGSIVSASPSVSSCSSAAVTLEAEQMAMILGAVADITQVGADGHDP